MRPITRLAAAAIGVLALAAPAYAGDANHSAGASGMLGGSSHPGTLRPMPRPAGFSVYPGTYGYNPGYIGAVGTFSQPAYTATQFHNGQWVDGIVSNGTFYAKSGTQTTNLSSRPSKAKDSRPSPNPNGNLGNKGASAKGGKGKRK